jgi:hypothetical protein
MTADLALAGGLTAQEKAVLTYLGFSPDDIKAQALIVIGRRYDLDPILKQVDLFQGNVYVTHAGMLAYAHRSGLLDGIVVEEQHESEHGYSATVSVYRKVMTHPFTYKGGCGIDEPIAKQGHGPEMALARAERRALCRAFSITINEDIDEPIVENGQPERHEMLTGRTATDPWYRCSCGQRYRTMADFHAHKKIPGPVPPPAAVPVAVVDAGASGPPLPAPTGPGPAKRRRDDPPPEYYDQLPESRNLR